MNNDAEQRGVEYLMDEKIKDGRQQGDVLADLPWSCAESLGMRPFIVGTGLLKAVKSEPLLARFYGEGE